MCSWAVAVAPRFRAPALCVNRSNHHALEPRPVRGGHCYIAESNDGVTFTNIWHATKDQFNSPSIEKASLVQMPSGAFHLYISYVDPADNRWRIAVLTAASPSEFDPAKRQPVLVAEKGIEGVKVLPLRDITVVRAGSTA